MPDMMAIVSKAVFEKDARGKSIGDTWQTARYASQNKALSALAGGDLYLVTVRPPDEALWLVAVLSQPQFDGTQWTAAPNTQPIRDISALKTQLRFANGQGLPYKPGTLGMSLQTPRVLVADDIELLAANPTGVRSSRRQAAKPPRQEIEQRTRHPNPKPGGSAVPRPKPHRTESSSNGRAGDSHLSRAREQLRHHQLDAALASLLAAWRDAPHPELAELVGALSITARAPTAANLRGKTAAARAAWDERAERATAVDMPMLLESLTDVTSNDAIDRLAFVAKWMPDPRVDAALVGVLEAVPYRATSTQKFWRKMLPLMQLIRDPAQLARIEAITFDGVAATMAAWLRDQRDKLVLVLQERLSTDAEHDPIFDELAAAIGGKAAEGAADRASIEHLIQAVYDAPQDDGPRAVLADALIERNDPRGELITIQLRLQQEPDDRAMRAREKELLDAHAKGWLGDLAPVLMAGFRFERGFLAECRVDDARQDRIEKLVGNPAWATVHTFAGPSTISLHSVMRSLRSLRFNSASSGNVEAWRDLLVETERPLEALHYMNIRSERQWLDTVEGRRWVDVSNHAEVDALGTCAALPKLKRLAIEDHPVLYIGPLAKAPVLARLDELGFHFDRNNRFWGERSSPLVDFKALLAEARVPKLRFEIGSFHITTLELERGARGYESARLEIGPDMRSNWSGQLVDEAIRMLDAIPGLRRLQLVARQSTEKQQVARLRAAATQLKLELV